MENHRANDGGQPAVISRRPVWTADKQHRLLAALCLGNFNALVYGQLSDRRSFNL